MTRLLKFLTVGLWILIFSVWIGDLWVGIPTDVSDGVTQGIVEPNRADINIEIQNRRLVSTGLLVPALGLFGLVGYSIWKKNDLLFYIGMTITIFPILTIGVVGLIQESEMPYKNLILTIICIPLTLGLMKGIAEIIRLRNSKR